MILNFTGAEPDAETARFRPIIFLSYKKGRRILKLCFGQ